MKNNAEKKIFVSYRVQDTSSETGRLVDSLKNYFTEDQLFMDIENLEFGSDFGASIEKSLSDCEVFLAVIGPHWAGERTGGPSRINDEDDWVRTEVATALRRNIRVVPVLMDGGALPKAEDLPADLQPLLRRQAIEISNKRWRYDTDQLVRFLVKTAGISPKKAAAQRAASAAPKTGKTWLYVAAGFVLAIVVLVIAALQMENEKAANTQQQVNAAGLTQSSTPVNSEVKDPPTVEPTEPVNNVTEINISGAWDGIEETDAPTFFFTQNGLQLGVQVQMAGQVIGTGTGQISGRKVEVNVPLEGIVTTLSATLSDDGATLNGTFHVPATATSEPVRLVRRSN
jgi:hypothetical protein